jgi:hypothetical protein
MSRNTLPARDAGATGAPLAVSPAPLLIGFLAGPILWSMHIIVSEIVVSSVCSTSGGFVEGRIILMAVSLLFVCGGISVDLIALRSWRQSGGSIDVTGAWGGAPGRSGWMALAGILLSTMFLFGILLGALPLFWLTGCGA